MKQPEFITFLNDAISHTIEKSDVILVFLKNGTCWVCDKNFKPSNDGKRTRYKLATR